MNGRIIFHYKILDKLGSGGMGVVYKAEDTKLERLVAIKFLPHHITANDEERQRFKIEAKAAAALNHPNIATIHAIEEVDDQMFIVMEFIDGQELRKLLIDHGPLSIDNCLSYAIQIAEGLKAAHAKGITHRDVKSSNLWLVELRDNKVETKPLVQGTSSYGYPAISPDGKWVAFNMGKFPYTHIYKMPIAGEHRNN